MDHTGIGVPFFSYKKLFGCMVRIIYRLLLRTIYKLLCKDGGLDTSLRLKLDIDVICKRELVATFERHTSIISQVHKQSINIKSISEFCI